LVPADTITILRALGGRRLCKIITPDGVVPYDNAARFDVTRKQVAGIGDLHDVLLELSGDHAACVVRGGLLDPNNTRGIRRRMHGDDAALRDFSRRWVALDIDGVELPTGIELDDILACADAVVPHLPPEFARVSCVVQATASHSIKPGAHLRLWYWLDRLLSDAELKVWLRSAPVDLALFNAVQIHYTAAPIFRNMRDPLHERVAVLGGVKSVVTPQNITPQQPFTHALRARSAPRDGGLSIMCRAAAQIACAEPGERHRSAIAAALSLAEMVRRDAISAEDAAEVIGTALHDAGKATHEAAAEAAGLVRWALSVKDEEAARLHALNTASGDFMMECGE
jgi:hypothetical protein